MSEYAVTRLEGIDEITDGREPWRPVRHHFGITSFGINAWTGREAGDRIITEHDEEGEDEELYFVHSGRARFEFDGEPVDAPAGRLYQEGRYAEAADLARELAAAHPEYPALLYNLACCESLAGRKADAI